MKRGAIGCIEPVLRVERQELDLCAFGQFSGLIDDKTTRLDSSLQCHADDGSIGVRRRQAEILGRLWVSPKPLATMT